MTRENSLFGLKQDKSIKTNEKKRRKQPKPTEKAAHTHLQQQRKISRRKKNG